MAKLFSRNLNFTFFHGMYIFRCHSITKIALNAIAYHMHIVIK